MRSEIRAEGSSGRGRSASTRQEAPAARESLPRTVLAMNSVAELLQFAKDTRLRLLADDLLRLLDEAREWLFTDGEEHIFSFNSVCSSLGLDPGYIRRGLKRWEEHARAATRKKQRGSAAAPERLVA